MKAESYQSNIIDERKCEVVESVLALFLKKRSQPKILWIACVFVPHMPNIWESLCVLKTNNNTIFTFSLHINLENYIKNKLKTSSTRKYSLLYFTYSNIGNYGDQIR